MKQGDIVNIEFTGRIKDTGDIFDTTNEETAKLAGIHSPKTNYGPVPIIIGANQILPGMEDAVKEMNVGDSKKIDLASEKAFGEKNAELVKIIPMSVFKENNLEPAIDRIVDFNGLKGKILSVDGGRVKVDFNHPLAGKDIQYEIEVKGEVTETGEKVKAIVRYFTGIKYEDSEVTVNSAETAIMIKKFGLTRQLKENISDTIMKWVDGISKVSFVDVFEKKN
ncbi:MAG: FKBP-type peptidyl-prolyl cis-trans isomerase [Candidatus Aenigmarchaeota archaeon]|nr:FKBP-type peptidyl-prolyl cis-trans isomerase [Candidatus Aenigmarchaeota archaeon]